MSIYNNGSFSQKIKAIVKSLYNDISFDDFPEPPPTFMYLVDDDGKYLVDDDGKFLITN